MRMPRLRLSIAAMMLFVVIIGLGLTALRIGSDAALKAVYSATTFILLLAIIAARFRPAGENAFWYGFAVFGWGYFLISLAPWHEWTAFTNSPGPGLPMDPNVPPTFFIMPRANPLLPTD